MTICQWVLAENFTTMVSAGHTCNLERAASILEAAGYQIDELKRLLWRKRRQLFFNTNFEMKRLLEPVFKDHGSETINQIFEGYYQLVADAEGYMLGISARTALVREWNVLLHEYPLLLTPYLMRPGYPYDHDETFDGVKDLFDSSIYSYGVNYIGIPAGFVPVDLVTSCLLVFNSSVKNGAKI